MKASTQRPYAGAPDMRRMQGALADGYDEMLVRVGDIAWRARLHTHRELSLEIELWERNDQLVGWTWFRGNGGFDVMLLPVHRGDGALLDEMLTFVDRTVHSVVAAGDPLQSVYTFFDADDRDMAGALSARGYEDALAAGGDVLTQDLDTPPDPVLPPGYHLGRVATEAHLLGRVEAHRAAFPASMMTADVYQRVQRTWPYRDELDRIVLTDDDVVVAFCTAWLDEHNQAGLLEPIGTHPDHQRRGLGRATTLDALRALHGAGARRAQVGTSGTAARATYSAIGFRPWKREVTYTKAL